MTTYSLTIPDDVWAEWKDTVPRSMSLRDRIVELLEADTEGRVLEQTIEDSPDQDDGADADPDDVAKAAETVEKIQDEISPDE